MHTRSINEILASCIEWRTESGNVERLFLKADKDICSVDGNVEDLLTSVMYDCLLKCKVLLRYYEGECISGRAQSDDAKLAFSVLRSCLRKFGLEYNTPTLIVLGSKRYARYRENYLDEIKVIENKIKDIV